jgi:hypothetical protein
MFPEHANAALNSTLEANASVIDSNAVFINQDNIFPLTYAEFLSAVLIPYTAILLIQADQDSTFSATWETWHDSGRWGAVYSHEDQYDRESQGAVKPAVHPSITQVKAEPRMRPYPRHQHPSLGHVSWYKMLRVNRWM